VANLWFFQASTAENMPTGLSVMVYLLGLRWWLADWRIRDATAEVVRCSAAAVFAAVRRTPRRALAVPPQEHGLSSYLWAP